MSSADHGRSNQEWLNELNDPDGARERALIDLRRILTRSLRRSFKGSRAAGAAVIEDIVQESLIKILANLKSFRSESRFTTWTVTIAVNLLLTELRRRRWQDVSLDSFENVELAFDPDALGAGDDHPERKAVKRELVESVNRAIRNSLTERQRLVLRAFLSGGMPLGEIAERLGTNRNALYKLMHDARKNLKRAVLAQGLSEAEIREILSW